MSNCRANLGTGLTILNLKDRKEVKQFFIEVLEDDQDLHANGSDYWDEGETGTPHPDEDRNLCLCEELGYESQRDMIIGEAMKNKSIRTPKSFKRVFDKVFSALSGQEFFGDCEWHSVVVDNDRIAVSWATGGDNQF